MQIIGLDLCITNLVDDHNFVEVMQVCVYCQATADLSKPAPSYSHLNLCMQLLWKAIQRSIRLEHTMCQNFIIGS